MGAKAKKIELYLYNGTLNGMTYVSESDGWDLGGILYSCPRDSINTLLKDGTCDKSGVYLLLSTEKVYIGQTTDLKKRIKQHLLSKDWWEKVIILTSKNNELGQSYITYLESELIRKAQECGTLDCDNRTIGNKNDLDQFNKKVVDQYIDESLFILQLIGVDVFFKERKKQSIIRSVPENTKKSIELRAKSEAVEFIKSQQFQLLPTKSYAKLQEKKNTFWINPRIEYLNKDWDLILNNQLTKTLYVLRIPANTFKSSLNKSGTLLVRKDKHFYIDLNLDSFSYVDKRSNISFKPFIILSINY